MLEIYLNNLFVSRNYIWIESRDKQEEDNVDEDITDINYK